MSHAPKIDDLVNAEDPTKLFELIEEIAVGSYGTVYRVKPLNLSILYI